MFIVQSREGVILSKFRDQTNLYLKCFLFRSEYVLKNFGLLDKEATTLVARQVQSRGRLLGRITSRRAGGGK